MDNDIPPVTVLLYHNISSSADTPSFRNDGIVIATLVEHLRALHDNGVETISLKAAFDLLDTDAKNITSPKCVLTFDDAMEGVHHFFPVLLEEIGNNMTVFIITDYVGQTNLWNPRAPNIVSHMSLPMLQDLGGQGVDLQLHGVDHHNLVKFSEQELEQRFSRGIEWFEAHLGYAPQFLAYPYGALTPTVTAVAQRYFSGAVSVNHGQWWAQEARWCLNRISVPAYLSGEDLISLIRTAPDKRWLKAEQKAPWWNKKEGE